MRPSSDSDPVVLRVRDGDLVDHGSWVYVWLRPGQERPVVYVGGTGLPPTVRTWLHLHDPDPDVGRVAARYPDLAGEALDVLAFALPAGLARPAAKAAVIARLHAASLLSERYVGEPPSAAPLPPEAVDLAERIVNRLAR